MKNENIKNSEKTSMEATAYMLLMWHEDRMRENEDKGIIGGNEIRKQANQHNGAGGGGRGRQERAQSGQTSSS